jgi:hypothetical protein
MYLHVLGFDTVEQAQEAAQINFTCTKMTVEEQNDVALVSFQTKDPIGPVTRMLLAQETQAGTAMFNEPLVGAPPRYSVSLGQIMVTFATAMFFLGLAMDYGFAIAQTISAVVATGWIAWCSNDILALAVGKARQDEKEVQG